jgi:hypothetical protein
LIDVIGVDDLILNACLSSMCNPSELMAVRQVSVMRSLNRVISIIRIRSQTPMLGSSLKVMCRGAMVLGSGMVDEVLSLSSHRIPHWESGKWAVQPTHLVLENLTFFLLEQKRNLLCLESLPYLAISPDSGRIDLRFRGVP